MSDILQNALRYNANNTQRVDTLGQNSGQLVAGKTGVLGFDCSGYFTHVLRESGFNVPRLTASGFQKSPLFQNVAIADVKPGDAIFFNGHTGFVVSFNSSTGIGIFRSMTGSNNAGILKDAPFSTSNKAPNQDAPYWGTSDKKWVSFGRVDQAAYNPNMDAHSNGNTVPVLHPLIATVPNGYAPTGIPNAPSVPLGYTELTGDTQTGRLYDNGVLYTKNIQTGGEFWRVPTATGGVIEITQIVGGAVARVEYTAAGTLDTSAQNAIQFAQQQSFTISSMSGMTANLQATSNAGLQTFQDILNNDPQVIINPTINGQGIKVVSGGNTYTLTGGQLIQNVTDASGNVTGVNFLAGQLAGQTMNISADGGYMFTAAERDALVQSGAFVKNFASTGAPVDTTGLTGEATPQNFNGIIHTTFTETGTGNVIADITFQSEWSNGQRLGSITTVYKNNIITQTVDTVLNGNAVNVTYTYDAITGEPVPHVNSINGQPPTDQAAADTALRQSGVGPGQLMFGDTGVTGTNASRIVSTYDGAHPNGLQALMKSLPTVIDALSLIKAIQTGQPLPIVASGLRLANDFTKTPNYNLSGAANVAGSVLSLMSLDAALKRGDTLGAVTAGAQTLSLGTQAYANLVLHNSADLAGGSTQAMYEFLNGTAKFDSAGNLLKAGDPGVLPALNLVNYIAQGDGVGAAISTLQIANSMGLMTVPFIGEIAMAYTAFNMITSLFGGSDAPPEAWGSAHAQWSGFNTTTSSVGGFGGLESATQTYNGVLAYLGQLAAQEQYLNPGSSIGVVANRMPSLSYRNYTGYQITDIDPLTGVQRNPDTKYDLTGHPYNAPAGSVQASQSLSERMIRVALERGALAPIWEVQTAALQTSAGDPMAGLTEEERAGRAGMLAPQPPQPPLSGGSQTFRPVALDLNGDGVQTTGANRTVAFDVDGSGYLKNTAWLSNNDGFLFLDRNLNGSIDTGSELFNNSVVSLTARGLNGMRWIDSNYDGRLTALDPVWNELKVWQDANGNGSADAGEVKTMAQLGITSLNYAMSTFEQNGQIKQLASPDLQADTEGTRTHVVPEGIIIQTSNGKTSLLATRIDDKSVLEANRDGITSYEDIETIISGADLLANDTLAGLSGSNLSITGVSGFTHGTGFLDGNGFVHYTPDANCFGAAQFNYTLKASTGQSNAANDCNWFGDRRAA